MAGQDHITALQTDFEIGAPGFFGCIGEVFRPHYRAVFALQGFGELHADAALVDGQTSDG